MARHPLVSVHLPRGQSLQITTDEGFEFLVVNHDTSYTPPGDRLGLSVHAEEYVGETTTLFHAEPDLARPPQKDIADAEPGDRIKPPPGAPDFDEILITKPEPYGGFVPPLLDLDSMLRGAVRAGDAVADVLSATGQASSPAPAAPPVAPHYQPAPQTPREPLSGGLESTPAPAAAPPGLRPMEEAPRDHSYVVVRTGDQESAVRWNSGFGQQFWIDSDGQTAGDDDSFEGWRSATQEDREEYGL